MDNNFTHILCIKVWSPHLKMIIKASNIESIIKGKIIRQSYYNESLIKINWIMNIFNEPYNEMLAGDLVTNSSFYDAIIYENTKLFIKNIENELKAENKLDNKNVIIFTITKPIMEKFSSPNKIGLIGY
jgi:hypothetical protein